MMELFKRLFKSNSNGTREEARRQGFSISDIERNLPMFSRNMQTLELKAGKVVRYSILRRGVTNTTWEMLQRLPSYGSNMPNDYLLTSVGALTDEATEELKKIATEFSEEYFEFEATISEIVVYWEEWGGPKKGSTSSLNSR